MKLTAFLKHNFHPSELVSHIKQIPKLSLSLSIDKNVVGINFVTFYFKFFLASI